MDEQERIQQAIDRAKNRARDIKQSELGPKYQLPNYEEFVRILPNPMARSGLFSPIARGKRKTLYMEKLPSRSDINIYFSGKQLDEADRDVFLQAIHCARNVPLGEWVEINRADFLKSIGRDTGKSNYKWLNESFIRLAFGMFVIETNNYKLGGTEGEKILRLIQEYERKNDVYKLKIDPRIIVMFNLNEYSWIDWQKRFLIEKRIDMAKWLQCLICSNQKGIQRYSINDLKTWMNYESPINKFKIALAESLEELKRIRLIKNITFEKSQKGCEQISVFRI